MRVEVRPLYENGKLIITDKNVERASYRGELSMTENRMHRWNRAVACASLVSHTDTSIHVLPELCDVKLLGIVGSKMRISGVEEVGGTLYAQTWSVTVTHA